MKEGNIPNHIGIIMDGNRRWAKEHKAIRLEGHMKGAERIEPLVEESAKLGISNLTFYSFSTENWSRESEEIDDLINVFRFMLKSPVVKRLQNRGVRVKIIGDYGGFPSDVRESIQKIEEDTKDNDAINVNFAVGYGGRQEIVQAVNKLLKEDLTEITENDISASLYTKDQPDPDLIIRTGGEQRLSGFLLWQSQYSELYFTDVYWPDFTPEELHNALTEYENRKRRFGK